MKKELAKIILVIWGGLFIGLLIGFSFRYPEFAKVVGVVFFCIVFVASIAWASAELGYKRAKYPPRPRKKK
jgi:hypothetical protein